MVSYTRCSGHILMAFWSLVVHVVMVVSCSDGNA